MITEPQLVFRGTLSGRTACSNPCAEIEVDTVIEVPRKNGKSSMQNVSTARRMQSMSYSEYRARLYGLMYGTTTIPNPVSGEVGMYNFASAIEVDADGKFVRELIPAGLVIADGTTELVGKLARKLPTDAVEGQIRILSRKLEVVGSL